MAEQEAQMRRRRRQMGNSTNNEHSNHSESDSDVDDEGAANHPDGPRQSVDGARGEGKTDRNNLNLINVRDGEPPQTFDKNSSRSTGK